MSGASKLEGQNHHPSIHQPSILRVQDSILLHKKQARKQEEPESSSSKREQQPAGGVQQQQAQRDASMAAAYQVLEVTLISAKDLKRVTLFTKMRVYAVASISGGDPRLPTHRTYADREGGRNPMWHAPLRFTIPPAADPRGLALHVLLRAERAFGDRDVGEVVVPMKDLAAASPEGDGAEQRHLSYQVRRPVSGRKRGVLHISYRLSDAPAPGPDAHPQHHRFSLAPPPSSFASKRHHGKGADSAITAYPVATTPRGGARQYPPPYHHQPYGYGGPGAAYPHHHQYGYGAYGYGGAPHGGAPYGYGGHSAAPAARSGGAGMGTAAGLGLGLLGGLMIGDMIADNDVDAAYDGGFMDGAMGC